MSFVVIFDVQNGIVGLSVDQLLTDTALKYQPTISEVSVKCRRSVREVSVKYR